MPRKLVALTSEWCHDLYLRVAILVLWVVLLRVMGALVVNFRLLLTALILCNTGVGRGNSREHIWLSNQRNI